MIDLNDPRLTAFALGELDGAESQEIEAAVQAHRNCNAKLLLFNKARNFCRPL